MSRKRSHAALEAYRGRFVEGARGKGVDEDDAERDLRQARRLLRLRLPEVARGRVRAARVPVRLAAPPLSRRSSSRALLNAQPMGFYPPATLVRDGQRRGVETRAAGREPRRRALRDRGRSRARSVSLRGAGGRGRGRGARRRADAGRPVRRHPRARPARRRCSGRRLEALVESGACDSFGLAAPRAALAARARAAVADRPRLRRRGASARAPARPDRRDADLPEQTAWERMLADYRTTRISVGVHPLELLRPHLPPGTLSSERAAASGRTARASGSPGWSSRASARRPRTASSSCCSRTSTPR